MHGTGDGSPVNPRFIDYMKSNATVDEPSPPVLRGIVDAAALRPSAQSPAEQVRAKERKIDSHEDCYRSDFVGYGQNQTVGETSETR